MNSRYSRFLLTVIAVALVLLVIRQYQTPVTVQAQGERSNFFVEPGYTTLRSPDGLTQQLGKVVINLNNGDVWGFPTLNNSPYPIDVGKTKPPVSKPVLLAQFDFSAMRK